MRPHPAASPRRRPARGDAATIEGFASGIDKIDLTGFGGLRWAENGDFAGTGQGEVGFLGQMIVIDADGDGQIDAMIEMVALNDMVRGDFIL